MQHTSFENERHFPQDKLLVSKTDAAGKITYVNSEFIKISGYSEAELIGKPHKIVRHPDMPRIIFKMLWQYLKDGYEIHAYVKNRCKDGGYYWVLANVTPSYDVDGRVIGYHSARRNPDPASLQAVKSLYATLLAEERRGGMDASQAYLKERFQKEGVRYEEFILAV